MRLVADANVLLSAAIGGAASRVLRDPSIQEVLAAESAVMEVHEYAALLARKKRLPVETVLAAVASLPVVVVDRAVYASRLREAEKRIGRRDPDDVETLALALHLGLTVWSNDDDLDGVGVPWRTTAELLQELDETR